MNPKLRSLGFWLAFFASALGLSWWMYTPAMNGAPIWDDNEALFNYPLISSPFSTVARIWLSHQAPDFWPLHYTWFWYAYRWWGTWTFPYHLTNIILHALNTTLIAAILRRLKTPGALFCALLFCVHPVSTEAVAWIVQFKTLASTSLCLGSWLAFLAYLERIPHSNDNPGADKRSVHVTTSSARIYIPYALSLLLFVAALLTKSAVIFSPIILTTAAFVTLRGWRRTTFSVAPFFAAAIISGIAAASWYAPDAGLPLGETLDLGPLYLRLARAGWNFWFYLKQAMWPSEIAFIYPKLDLDSASPWTYLPCLAAVALPLVALWGHRRWGWAVPAAVCYYGLALAPVIGIYAIYFMRFADVADHWQYMAIIAPIYLVVQLGMKLSVPNSVKLTAACALIGCLAHKTQQQAAVYQSEKVIWSDTLKRNPKSWLAYNNLGKILLAEQNFSEAEIHFQSALKLKPDFRDAFNNLGASYIEQNQLDEALRTLQHTVKLWPDYAAARSNLGVALTRLSRFDEAAVQLRRASELAPEDASYHKNLGYTQQRLRQLDASIASYRRAVSLSPRPDYYSDLGQILREAGYLDDAVVALQQALRMQPNHGLAMANIGFIAMARGDLKSALHWLEQATLASPDSAMIHLAFASCLLDAGDRAKATKQLSAALSIDPATPGAADLAARLRDASGR